MLLLGWALLVSGCDRESPAPAESPAPTAPVSAQATAEDPAAALREAVLPPGAEVTGTTRTLDDEGHPVEVTTFEAPPPPASDLAALRASCADGHCWSCDALGLPMPTR
jgi:hypothetical protein